MAQQTTQSEAPAAPANEPPKSESLPPIVELAFGKAEAEPAPPASEPAPKPPAEPKTEPKTEPPAEPTPAAKPNGSRENKRIQQFINTIKTKEGRINELEKELEKLRVKDAPDAPESAIERKFAEKELEQTQREQNEAYSELAAEQLVEAFPNEADRQEFIELSSDFGPSIDKYAPKVSEYIINSDINYKLAQTFYNILASEPNALRDFLNQPFSVQKKNLAGLEAYIKSPPPASPVPATSQPAPAVPDSAYIPKSIIPSDSGSQAAGTPDPYLYTLERIAEQNRRIYGR